MTYDIWNLNCDSIVEIAIIILYIKHDFGLVVVLKIALYGCGGHTIRQSAYNLSFNYGDP